MGCGNKTFGEDSEMLAEDLYYHRGCIKCAMCSAQPREDVPIVMAAREVDDVFAPEILDPYCKFCYAKKFKTEPRSLRLASPGTWRAAPPRTPSGGRRLLLLTRTATSLNRRPMTRMFGRQMIFFKCADRTERRVCTEAQLLENLETFYGSESDEETAERIAAIGLPEDKYDAAAISIAVIQNAQSEEEKFVERFMWNLNGDSSM